MSERILAATRKGLFTIARNGGDWKVAGGAFIGDNVTLAARDPRTGRLLAALDHGHFGVKLHVSDDDGRSWREVRPPEYPPQPEGAAEEVNPMTGKPIPWSLKLIWALAPGAADQPGLMWCGTVPGGLFRSTDGGETWELVRSLWDHPSRKEWFGGGLDYPGVHSICIDPRDSNKLTLGVSCGGVWRTTDGGETWAVRAKGMFADYMPPERREDENIQDPHQVVQCSGQPDKFWAQHHNGVFRSVDDCRTWTHVPDVPPSSFGFAVVVHPTDGDTAWFVPAIKDEKRIPVDGKVVVTRTRDGGKTFDVLRDGLPQEHAYDLVFRHALDIDAAGRRLAMGSTTGSLWVSEDQGDSWRNVSAHLPPVHCVRFA
ncbi:MAG: exo-alpha-sialidase [Planctomycetota bacterium]|nr:MAG: exo-alpha-sialidase [Planctomycetota bacterium]